ncbi:hypothetical protein A5886_001929 [Enterococcus sp. 8G7_MSG3316]|uniref:ABC-2 type transporter transmembrane domain-containing protein n=1 Tax=Candidatus Enterococcus testudinis TaxID=1834191 RepID=A0A242A7I8_9ENTE|nr:ABC transporter permease [Enterococcus sp. 8G7_MSG3316]OTN76850.1 hypothetical protein A5886_001929 [Enterococcus sp. 8G7_MSG3316]
MMITRHKTTALLNFKFREILKNKTFLVSAAMVPGFVLMYRLLFDDVENMSGIQVFLLNFGVSYAMIMVGMFMSATFLAKDKEKQTLRTWMTSSVSSLEYLVSMIIPFLVLTILMIVMVIGISGMNPEAIDFPVFILVIFLSSLTAIILGMLVGLVSKNQMAASNNSLLFVFIFFLVPTFSDMNQTLERISEFLFTGVVSNMIAGFGEGGLPLAMQDYLVLIGSLVLAIVAFIMVYRKNGFETD